MEKFVIRCFEQFGPKWLHENVKGQLLSPALDWHYPGYGGYSTDLKNACFARQPYNIATSYENWSGVESLTYMLDWWINSNKDWFQFLGLNRCLINFYTPGQNTNWHVDHDSYDFFSLLYYVNDADGGTEFKDKKIPHKENSGVFFSSPILHTPITSTVPRRINVNWIMRGKILD